MSKTLLKQSIIPTLQKGAMRQEELQDECLHKLVREMKHVLMQAEQDLLSPRPDAVKQLLHRALN